MRLVPKLGLSMCLSVDTKTGWVQVHNKYMYQSFQVATKTKTTAFYICLEYAKICLAVVNFTQLFVYMTYFFTV